MKKLLAICIIILIGCTKKEKKTPSLLPKDQLVDIMLHLTLMEEKLSIMATPKDTAQHMFDYYRDKLFMEQGVKSTEFDDSYNYYLIHDLKGFEELQDAMLDSLTKYKNTLKTFE